MGNHVRLKSRVLRQLLNARIGISILNFSRPADSVIIYPSRGQNIALRLAQYKASAETRKSLQVARQVVHLKLRNTQKVLGQSQRRVLTRSCQHVAEIRDRLPQAQNLDVVRGMEGTAGRAFWKAFGVLVPPGFVFSGRKRRPPPDPVNALLSLSFTLLHHRAVLVCARKSLDPLLGFLHRPLHNRESLACDLIEPWRPLVCDWVLQQFKQGIFRPRDFSQEPKKGCRLNKAARRRYYGEFYQILSAHERAMLRHLHVLARYLESQSGTPENGGLT